MSKNSEMVATPTWAATASILGACLAHGDSAAAKHDAAVELRRMGKGLDDAQAELTELRRQLKEIPDHARPLLSGDIPHILISFENLNNREFLIGMIAHWEDEGEINFPFNITKLGSSRKVHS